MKKLKVLFICVHNSARSQMASAFLNNMCPEYFEAHSAGLDSGMINPLAVEVMAELGIDISKNKPQGVFDVWRSGIAFAYVVRVCSEAEAQARDCPIFPSPTTRLSWPFEDPAKFAGTHDERLEKTRRLRDQIHAKIDSFCQEHCVASSG